MSRTTALDDRTASAIRDAIAAASLGRIADARRIGENALAMGGDEAALNAMLGTFCVRSGEFASAADHLRIARRKRPDDVTIAFNLATALAQLGLYEEALEAAPEPLARSDLSLRLERIRGFCAQSLGSYLDAVAAYERIVDAFPKDWESWNNLGNSRRCVGDVEGAIEALRRAAELAPDSPPVRLNFASALVEGGRPAEAEAEFRSMASVFPEDWRALRDLHLLCRSQGREEDALQAIEESRRRNPDDLELILAVASQRLLLLDNEGAESAYREAVTRDPRNASGNLGIAVVYDLANKTADLSRFVSEAKTRGIDDDVLNFIRAFDHRRAKRFEDGLTAIRAVPSELESARRAHLLGQLNDGAGNYDEAWRAFSRMNELQSEDPSDPVARASRYRQAIRRNFDETTQAWAQSWIDGSTEKDRRSPVFLIGFPRSGTTLLDTMLMGHPDVQVLEEEPALHSAVAMLPDYLSLPRTSQDAITAARVAYFDAVSRRVAIDPGKLIIDKNPLFTVALPHIRRIFPDARIIVAVRHPCDVVLSCFTTNFRLNDGMSSFLHLDTTAELYDLAFSYFERMQRLLPMAAHTVVYEKLIADQERELKSLFEFLGLSWIPDVLDHQKTAFERGRIKTASYSQVVEPIYSRSAGRWRNYEAHLAPIMPVLKPWIEKFGFDL